ncbi:MAG: hypothetical protein HOM16_08020 [Woeseia sp.]|jgi:hypothetical protein|nr:hypothetical protein [Woeseia sp.]
MSEPIVLFVDDEAGVLRAMKRLFRKESVTVMTASEGAEGWTCWNNILSASLYQINACQKCAGRIF